MSNMQPALDSAKERLAALQASGDAGTTIGRDAIFRQRVSVALIERIMKANRPQGSTDG